MTFEYYFFNHECMDTVATPLLVDNIFTTFFISRSTLDYLQSGVPEIDESSKAKLGHIKFEKEELEDVLKLLNPTKPPTGPDSISNKLHKMLASKLSYPLIFQSMFLVYVCMEAGMCYSKP